ncbi:hypothetical protein BAE44_0014551 [Dichanthelium oligosanthes]|uniref:F-box domain-containing protein n=1 Tax=Dichanthelium oligosanthes TaxID=888268 RepID=A0A1E5VH23_9POAL|nr:hypothetical protein BAE44_0014551 [Dichanthelium oligosanthes]
MSLSTDSMAEASGDARMVSPGDAGAVCRINSLPSDVLTRAISFLDARQLVQTCVLSRRWRDLWRSVPRINASRHEFDGMAGTEEERHVLFKKFINRFLMLRNPVALDEFWLRYNITYYSDPDADSEDANLWIRHALQSNARSVEVFGGGVISLQLDPAVFASECCFLTSMLLSDVFLEPPFFRNLQTGCPVSERLILRCCAIVDTEISSHTLKDLTIDDECHCIFEGRASISIPSLVDLHFFPNGTGIPLLENMESLVTASLLIRTDKDTQVDDIRQFLRSLSGVTELEFNCLGTTLEIEQNLQWCPKFNNLTTLTLDGWCLYEDFYPLIVFLQNSPNLEQLTLELREIFIKLHPYQGFIRYLEERSFTCVHLVRVDIVFETIYSDSKVILRFFMVWTHYTNQSFTVNLEERLFTCENLKIVEIVCWEESGNDPVLKNLEEKLFLDNGLTSRQIDMVTRVYLALRFYLNQSLEQVLPARLTMPV